MQAVKGTTEQQPDEMSPLQKERRRGDRRRVTTRRVRERRTTERLAAFFPMLLIASLSLTLLLVVFSWQSAKLRNAETRVFGAAIASSQASMSASAFDRLLERPEQSSLLAAVKGHPMFGYLIVESPHGQRRAENIAGQVTIPDLPLSASQRVVGGSRDFSTADRTVDLLEYFFPVEQAGNQVVRIGFLAPTFYWPPGALYYFLLSLPLVLLTFAALSSIIKTYVPMQVLGQHFKSLNESNELAVIDNSEARSPLFDDFNSLIANAKQIVSDIESKQDKLDLNRKLLQFDKARTDAVLNTLSIGIVVLDAAGAVSYHNKRFAKFFPSVEPPEAGAGFSDWCPSEEVMSYVESCRKNGDAAGQMQFCYAHRKSHEKIASVTIRPLKTMDQGEPLGVILVFQDISDVVHNKKMSEEFAIKAAHELKTPLHVVKMYSEMLMEDDIEPDLRVESLNTIYDEVDRMADLVNNLLNIAKIEMGSINVEKTRVKTAEFLNDIFENMSRAAANKTLDLQKQIPESLSPIVVDKDLLRIAINNLLSNAIKYNRDDGQVRLVAEENNEVVRIHVGDSGPGISQEDQQLVFDKFYRSEDEEIRKRSGHGLGLTLAKNIVQLHHGQLSVSSEPGEGSTFTIEFNKKSILGERGSQ
ncbi:ATP-binding protein [Litorivivens sp.]|uniref:sensor histidine kinase n=1 Tax=Litorivivens sp. TaxID=2020868 RepID=UPI003563E56D